jgi:hypothetical protein
VIRVDCESCGDFFEVAPTLAGGLANCPGCGRATPVPGLRDPLYRLALVGIPVAWVLLTWFGWMIAEWQGAAIVGGGAAVLLVVAYVSM